MKRLGMVWNARPLKVVGRCDDQVREDTKEEWGKGCVQPRSAGAEFPCGDSTT